MKSLKLSSLIYSLFCLVAAGAVQAQSTKATHAPGTLPPADHAPLISRDALFGNPQRPNVQISPDGKYLSWNAAVDGMINVWIAPARDLSKARDKACGISDYLWTGVRFALRGQSSCGF